MALPRIGLATVGVVSFIVVVCLLTGAEYASASPPFLIHGNAIKSLSDQYRRSISDSDQVLESPNTVSPTSAPVTSTYVNPVASVRLEGREREEALLSIPDWKLVGETINRNFIFPDFNTAFALMSRVALYAEKNEHHPDWFNSWNRLNISLTTSDCHCLSQRDINEARQIDIYLQQLPYTPA